MPIVEIAIAAALLVGLLVGAVAPARCIAERRSANGDRTTSTARVSGFVPLDWHRMASRQPAPPVDAELTQRRAA
ncbi:MAG TPA: hypothetical protein VEK39_08985 [Solirubrobacterales bacterium]|nr:hypothetical protein [Solirubrobacterales bacterium]